MSSSNLAEILAPNQPTTQNSDSKEPQKLQLRTTATAVQKPRILVKTPEPMEKDAHTQGLTNNANQSLISKLQQDIEEEVSIPV